MQLFVRAGPSLGLYTRLCNDQYPQVMNGNEYLYNTSDVYNRSRSDIVKISILIHSFSTFVAMNTVHPHVT